MLSDTTVFVGLMISNVRMKKMTQKILHFEVNGSYAWGSQRKDGLTTLDVNLINCSICCKGVSSNSIFCQSCNHWVHKRCSKIKGRLTGIILETVGGVQKIQKRALFHYKKVKKGTTNLTSPYIHSLFTTVLIKQIFEKNKSSSAVSGSWTQF